MVQTMYNLSEFMTLIKGDMGIKDVPLPVVDTELLNRFDISTLREFSVRYPYLSEAWVTSKDAVDMGERSLNGSIRYIIPEKYYQGTIILDVTHLMPGGYGSEANMYMPNVVLGSADALIESVADIKLAAALGSMMAHAPTRRFDPPNRLTIYNGWSSGSYRIELALKHDLSLSTIPPGAFTDLRQLAVLDLESFVYNKIRRINRIETGIGSIDLMIDTWENAESAKQDLLRTWDETDDFATSEIIYW